MRNILGLVMAIVFLSSCKKEGCIDSLAKNYDVEAKKSDNTCSYDASLIFWINASGSLNFDNSGISKITIYIDDTKIGEMNTNSSQLETPECNTVGITHLTELGSLTAKSINYKITYEGFGPPGADNEKTYAEGTLQLKGGICNSFLIQ